MAFECEHNGMGVFFVSISTKTIKGKVPCIGHGSFENK